MIHGFLPIIVRCLLNLDESVMSQALICIHELLSREPNIRTLFIKKRGFPILSDCLADYNLNIKTYSLKIISLIIADNKETKELIRETEILKQTVRIISNYPTYDVNLAVLDSALNVLSHSVTGSVSNQNFVRDLNGFSALSKAFTKLNEEISKLPKETKNPKLATLETLCLCISNICFHNQQNQEALLKQGIINQLILYLIDANAVKNIDIIQQMIFILVNSTDTNTAVQEYLLKHEKLIPLLEKYLFYESLLIAGYVALWISHISFNSKKSQEFIGTDKFISKLLSLCDYQKLTNSGLPAEASQQITFFSLLAIINLSYSNNTAQQLISSKSGIKLFCEILRDPNFAAKKTVCFALSNVIRGNEITQKELLGLDGVKLLAELVSDEEDDELSKKAFGTLEDMDKFAIDGFYPLIIGLGQTLNKIFINNSVDISIENTSGSMPLIIGMENDKITAEIETINKCKEKLGKYLPIFNGLVYMNEGIFYQ